MAPRRPASFVDHLFFHAAAQPDRPAVILHDRVATYAMMAQGARSVAARLRKLGFAPGEVVAIALESPIRHLIAMAALFDLGQPSLSAISPEAVLALGAPIRTILQDPGLALTPGINRVMVDESWFADAGAPRGPGFADEDALARVEITSGSTGVSKAVCNSFGEFQRRLAHQHAPQSFGVGGRVLGLLNLGSGLGSRLGAFVLQTGGTLIAAQAPREALNLASVYAAEAIVASTQQARDLMRALKAAPTPLPALRTILVGGSLATREFLKEAAARFAANVVVHYGATETGAIADAPLCRLLDLEGATGYALPNVEIEIVDEQEKPLPRGAQGAVRVRNDTMARPFPPERASEHPHLRDGWFYTGDSGRLEPDGLLVLSGRASQVINAGGLKLAPEIIEEVALGHPNVAEAAALGVLGPEGIVEIHIAIVPKSPVSEAHLIAWFGERNLEVAKIHAIDALPRTPMGKIAREELKARLTGGD
jgi:acyl-CoA synthetase (AMP-forming)/AMP-acid ligase II